MTARIYRPAKTAMQSGTAKTTRWLLEYEPEVAREIDPLMGWTGSRDMRQQLKLWFDSKEDALAYAQANGIPARIEEPNDPKRRTVSYSDNFRFNRVGTWTH